MTQDKQLLKRMLTMVSEKDEMFTMLSDEIISALEVNRYIQIGHENDVSDTTLTEKGRKIIEL